MMHLVGPLLRFFSTSSDNKSQEIRQPSLVNSAAQKAIASVPMTDVKKDSTLSKQQKCLSARQKTVNDIRMATLTNRILRTYLSAVDTIGIIQDYSDYDENVKRSLYPMAKVSVVF